VVVDVERKLQTRLAAVELVTPQAQVHHKVTMAAQALFKTLIVPVVGVAVLLALVRLARALMVGMVERQPQLQYQGLLHIMLVAVVAE
jgi:hypothetical protein